MLKNIEHIFLQQLITPGTYGLTPIYLWQIRIDFCKKCPLHNNQIISFMADAS